MKLVLPFSFLILFSCGSNVDKAGEETAKTIVDTSHSPVETLDSATIELIEWDSKYDVYQGQYFSIEYPSNFLAAPLKPIIDAEKYKFVDTDEATFTSPDGEVEFFVYSPLWGGEPKSYLIQKENEELTSEKEDSNESEIGWTKHIKWVTYTDKEGKYSRSFVSTKTESTDLVFGIKSINDAAYEKYKDAYVRFKESLTQFMDH